MEASFRKPLSSLGGLSEEYLFSELGHCRVSTDISGRDEKVALGNADNIVRWHCRGHD